MKKVVSMLAVVAFLFSMNVNAQEPAKKTKKAKTEKSCDKDKKGGCCAGKKADEKKA
ncbi:MAG: hypothetical protein K2P85_00300 [Flavobacteriaceae bacterium]|nr:hypothetical protein [Flavobacteriaceae bacterium]